MRRTFHLLSLHPGKASQIFEVFANNTILTTLTFLTYLSILKRLSVVHGTHMSFLMCNY